MKKVKKKPKKKKVLSKSDHIKAGFSEVAEGMFVGSVPLDKLKLRRPRFRRMDELQRRTLRDSIDRFGMKTFVLVRPGKNGSYEIVDGHHRIDEAKERGWSEVPVILAVDKDGKVLEPGQTDLAMLSFNVGAEIDEDVFLEFIHELADNVGSAEVARFTAMEESSLAEMVQAFDAEEDSEEEEDDFSSATQFDGAADDKVTHESSRGTPISILLPGTEEVQNLLDKVLDLYGVDSYADAVIESLNRALRKKGKKKKKKKE